MRITGFHVEGFGLLSDERVDGVGPGTTVVLGPNEAGKSTLHAFLVRTLFGHPRVNDAEGRHRHEPLRGGRHGGLVTCADERGRWEVHRYTSGSPRLRVVGPDGTEATGTDAVLPLVGHAVDAVRFEQVFAIDLDDLAGVGSLGDGALDDLLFDAATVGAGRSLRTARDEAVARRDALWTPASTKRPLARAVARRAAARDALTAARAAARSNVDVRRRLDEARARVDELAGRQEALATRIALLDRVRDAWPSWSRAEELRAQESEEPPLDDATAADPAALAVAGEVEALVEGLAAHELAGEQLAAAAADLEVATRAVAAALADLGPGWDVDRVRTVAVDAACRERLVAAGDACRTTRAAATEARDAVTAAERAAERQAAAVRDAVGALPAAPDPATVAASEQAVAVLRRGVPVVQGASGGAGRMAAVRGVPGPAAALLAAGVALLLPALLGLLPDGLPGTSAAVLGAVLAALGAHRAGTARGRASQHAAGHGLLGDVADAGRVVGLGATPSLAEVEQVAARVERDRRMLRDLAEAERRVARLRAEAVAATRTARDRAEVAARREAEHRAATARWASTCDEVGVLPDAGVRVVLTRHERVVTASRAIAERAAARDRVDRLRPRVEEFRAATAAVAADLGHDVGGRAAVRLLPGLRDRVRAARASEAARRRDRSAREAELAAAERNVDQLLGTGPRGEEGRALLREEDPTAWEQELAAAREARADAARERDDAVARRTELAGELRRLGGDDAVPRAQQELAAAELEVAELAERWAVADTAVRVLEVTVERVEQQQPRVLARASALVSRATGGRWAEVRRLDGQVVVAADPGGEPVPASVLSRGTREQLWLCLRLALAADLSRDRPLPLLVDDLLGTSDPERSRHVARVLADVARRQQVWVFTCRPRTADLVTSVDPTAGVLRLGRGGRVLGHTPGGDPPRAHDLPARSLER